MKVQIIKIGVDELGTLPQNLENRLEEFEIRERTKTIQSRLFFLDRREYWDQS